MDSSTLARLRWVSGVGGKRYVHDRADVDESLGEFVVDGVVWVDQAGDLCRVD